MAYNLVKLDDALFEAAYDHQVAAIKKSYPEKSNEIDEYLNQAKAVLKKSDRISYFLSVLRASYDGTISKINGTYQFVSFDTFRNVFFDYYSHNIPQIEQFVLTSPNTQPISEVFEKLEAIKLKYSQSDKAPVNPQAGDKPLLKFADGATWWYVDRAYCPEEGRSGKHCGNITGKFQVNQRILSLRNDKNQVMLTFIYMPNGELGEMKAKGNQKPGEGFHKYIVPLLLNKSLPIKGISSAVWGPEFNFSIFDLSKDYLKHLISNDRQDLVGAQINATPIEFLKAPDYIKNNPGAQKLAIKAMPELKMLIGNEESPRAWESAIQANPKLIVYAPNTIHNYEHRVITTLLRDPRLLIQCNAAITSNPNIMQTIIEGNPDNVVYVAPAAKLYNQLWDFAIKQKPSLVANLAAPDKIKNDKSAWINAVNSDLTLLFSNDTPDDIRFDEQIWKALLEKQPTMLQRPDLPAEVKNNIRLWQFVIQRSPNILFSDKTPKEIKQNSQIWTALISTTPEMITHASVPAELRSNVQLWKQAITASPAIITLNNTPLEIKNNSELWAIAVQQDPRLHLKMPASVKTAQGAYYGV